MRFVFVHGGPGFNSYAEQAMLAPVFARRGHDVAFWNEPSRLRPTGERFEPTAACERWLASAERFVMHAVGTSPVHVIAHSCTVHAAMEIARRHPQRVASLVLVAPGADTVATFMNVMRLARQDLVETRPDLAQTIAACMAATRAFFDDAMREGLMTVLHDDRLFTHYWADPVQMHASLAARAGPEAQFDVESFFAVFEDFVRRGTTLFSSDPVTVPTLALFGGDDPISPLAEQRAAIESAIPRARLQVLDRCSHYVHLDRPESFADVVLDWAADHADSSTRL
jgi:pimeloyl-ACP methyl ester carboxylesterase